MFELGAIPLGVTLLLIGLAFFLLTIFLLRVIPKNTSISKGSSQMPVVPDVPQHDNAVLVVQPGGRVSFMNQKARSRFNVWNEVPNLERLVRRTRPGDVFLGLCSTEGQARFSIDGQMVEATSYIVPNGNNNAVLLSIRPDQLTTPSLEESGYSNHIVEVLNVVSQSMAANLELEVTLQSILSGVDKLVPNDFAEITIWDPVEDHLIPYRFVGLPGADRRIELTDERYPMGEGYSGYVAEKRQPILVADVDTYRERRPIINRQKYPFHSYVGYPLVIGGELIGTLDLTSLDRDAFNENDVEVLRLLSGQAAVALHNALLYREEKRRALELSSLASLAQAVSSVRDSKELFAQLAEGISPLLEVQIAGFLVYEDVHRKLVAQNPFIGVPPQFIDLYQVDIPPDSPADKIWRDRETLVITNAGEDPQMIDLGLDHSSRAAGIKHTVLVPLIIGARSLGYLQAANKHDGTPFTQDDVRLLSIIASQAAPIIENADLVQQSIQRAFRAEALRRIASLSGSEAALDEILKYSVIELSRLLKVDSAAVFFLDESGGELQVHAASVYGVPPDLLEQLGRIPVAEEFSRFIVSNSQEPFISENAVEDRRISPPYRLLIDKLGVLSVADVPLVFRGRGLGEIMLGSNRSDHFTQSDIQLIMTVAGQLAVATERTMLGSQTDEFLRQRVEHLTGLTRLGRELNASLNLKRLLKRAFEEALNTTNADCGSILLFELDETKSSDYQIRLHYGEEPGKTFHPLEQIVLEKGKPVLVEDFNNPPKSLGESTLRPAHEGVQSALIVPIERQGDLIGLFHLHGEQPGCFDESDLQIAQALSVQAAVAIGNAHRYQEQVLDNQKLSNRVKALSALVESSEGTYADQPLEKPLRDIATCLQETTPFSEVLIGVLSDEKDVNWIATAGVEQDKLKSLRELMLTWPDVESVLQSEYLLANSYYIPVDGPTEVADWLSVLTNSHLKRGEHGAILLKPILRTAAEPLGLLAVASLPGDEYPERVSLEILDNYSLQARLVVDHHKWVDQLEYQVESLEAKLDLESDLAAPILAGIPPARMEKRVNSVLEIIENLARQPDRSTVLETLGQGLIATLGFDIALVVEMGTGGLQILHILGDVPQQLNLEALLGQRNPLQSSLNEGQLHLIPDVDASEHWRGSPLFEAFSGKGILSLPILSQAGSPVAVMALSSSPITDFSLDDEKLFDLLARQTATTLNNLTLLTETGQRLREVYLLLEFSRQLGGMEPEKAIRLLVESALEVVQLAQACMVVIFEPDRGVLKPKAASGYADNSTMLEIEFRPGEALVGQVFEEGRTQRISEVDFAQHYSLDAKELLSYRKATDGALPISSMVVPIQSGQVVLGVLVLDNFQEVDAFSIDDQALVGSLSRQAALTLENIHLYVAAEQRAEQLEALSTVSAEITTNLELDALVNSLLETLENVVPFDTATLWLRELDELSIRSVRGFDVGEDLLGLKTAVADSRLFAEMINTGQPISVGDIRKDERFPELPTERLSWLAVPMVTKGEVVGVIALEKAGIDFYETEHSQVLTTFANQAAVAMENAALYRQTLERSDELDRRSQRLAQINRFSDKISSSLDLNYLLEVTSQEIVQALSCQLVSIMLYRNGELLLLHQGPERDEDLPRQLPDAPLFERLQQSLGVFSTVDISEEDILEPLNGYFEETNTKALLVLPIVTGKNVNGFIFAHSAQSYRFRSDEIELSQILTNQAAVALENASLYAQTRQFTEELEQRVAERTGQLEQEHNRAQALLNIMRELSASLDLDHVLTRTLQLLNNITDSDQSSILLIKPGDKTFYYRSSLGYSDPPPIGGRTTQLDVGEGLLGWIVNHREGVLIEDLLEDERWVYSEELGSKHRSAMGIPLLVGAEVLGVMLLFHQQPSHFVSDQIELVQAAANQIAVSINNSELFKLIREQAERLGNLLRTQQIETSRSRSILEAVADGVLVTDADSKITLFNDSAQHILGLERDDVVGKSLENFSGLFGGTTQTWMNTISDWSSMSVEYGEGDTYAEQITLDDGRFVAINLAPVHMKDEFLGTVSIFRDITHQVELDRLKSEFVATVSHELRTPMTSIKGYVEILLMGAAGELSEQQTHFLEVVFSNTQRLNVLVNDLLDVSRIDAGKHHLSMESLRLQDLAEAVVAEQQQQAEKDEKPIVILFDVPSDLPRVQGDEERLRQILANLISNAYYYTPANGHIHIQARSLGDDIQVDVKDDGIGINEEEQERVFERFYRGEDPLVIATAGTGLGLSIVQQLIELHGGRIWVKSDGIPGKGSTFSFTLPIFIDD